MTDTTSVAFVWKDWDWRPLARLAVWTLLAATWARAHHILTVAMLRQALRESLMGFLFTCGLLTYVQALALALLLRLVLETDRAAYALAERVARSVTEGAPFAANFAATFGVELTLVLGAGQLWRAAHVSTRVVALLAEVLR